MSAILGRIISGTGPQDLPVPMGPPTLTPIGELQRRVYVGVSVLLNLQFLPMPVKPELPSVCLHLCPGPWRRNGAAAHCPSRACWACSRRSRAQLLQPASFARAEAQTDPRSGLCPASFAWVRQASLHSEVPLVVSVRSGSASFGRVPPHWSHSLCCSPLTFPFGVLSCHLVWSLVRTYSKRPPHNA